MRSSAPTLGAFRFQSITTQEFLDFLEARLPGSRPGRERSSSSMRRPAGRRAEAAIAAPRAASRFEVGTENPAELLVVLQALAPDSPRVRELDARFGLADRRSLELRHTSVLLQLRAGAPEAVDSARRILLASGRMRYLRPLYTELARRAPGGGAADLPGGRAGTTTSPGPQSKAC